MCETVTKLPLYIRATWRRSQSHVDCVEVPWDHENAIDAKFKLRNSRKLTLSQCRARLAVLVDGEAVVGAVREVAL